MFPVKSLLLLLITTVRLVFFLETVKMVLALDGAYFLSP